MSDEKWPVCCTKNMVSGPGFWECLVCKRRVPHQAEADVLRRQLSSTKTELAAAQAACAALVQNCENYCVKELCPGGGAACKDQCGLLAACKDEGQPYLDAMRVVRLIETLSKTGDVTIAYGLPPVFVIWRKLEGCTDPTSETFGGDTLLACLEQAAHAAGVEQ